MVVSATPHSEVVKSNFVKEVPLWRGSEDQGQLLPQAAPSPGGRAAPKGAVPADENWAVSPTVGASRRKGALLSAV